jgi:hypothetical protein
MNPILARAIEAAEGVTLIADPDVDHARMYNAALASAKKDGLDAVDAHAVATSASTDGTYPDGYKDLIEPWSAGHAVPSPAQVARWKTFSKPSGTMKESMMDNIQRFRDHLAIVHGISLPENASNEDVDKALQEAHPNGKCS